MRCMRCVYAFMRLWGGLIFLNGFRVVPPPVAGGAARFPSLKTVYMPVCLQTCMQPCACFVLLRLSRVEAAHACVPGSLQLIACAV
jgi:hypothetical protein